MSYQHNGYRMAFFLEHDSKETIQEWYYLFYNTGATNGSLNWIHANKAYFWTDKDGLIRAYTNVYLARIDDWSYERKKMVFKGQSGAGRTLAAEWALEQVEKIARIKGCFSLSGNYHEYTVAVEIGEAV